jgi:hypothetical protein
MITTEAMVAEAPKKREAPAAARRNGWHGLLISRKYRRPLPTQCGPGRPVPSATPPLSRGHRPEARARPTNRGAFSVCPLRSPRALQPRSVEDQPYGWMR